MFVCAREKHGGRISIFTLYSMCAHSMHKTIICENGYDAFCVRVCVSKQQKSETEVDIKQLTLGLHVFTAV